MKQYKLLKSISRIGPFICVYLNSPSIKTGFNVLDFQEVRARLTKVLLSYLCDPYEDFIRMGMLTNIMLLQVGIGLVIPLSSIFA